MTLGERFGKFCYQYSQPLILVFFSAVLVLFIGGIAHDFIIMGPEGETVFGYDTWLGSEDGQFYDFIADHGYGEIRPNAYNTHVFFPLYPLLGSIVRFVSGLNILDSMMLVSLVSTAVLSCVWIEYIRARTAHTLSPQTEICSVALLLFWPASFFLYMNYPEALYLMLIALFLLGMAKRWAIEWLILVCGLITAARSPGFICCGVLAVHVWRRLEGAKFFHRLVLTGAAGLASAWGILLFMLFLQWKYGDALLFIKLREIWNYGTPRDQFFSSIYSITAPLTDFFTQGNYHSPIRIIQYMQNPGSWMLFTVLLAVGACRRWLTLEEMLLCGVYLIMFYVSHAPKNMESIGRYTFSLLPIFLVMTRLLARRSLAFWMGMICFSAALMLLITMLFARKYNVF